MTRARQGLILARLDCGHRLLDALPDMPSLLHRSPAALPAPAPELARRYRRLTLREVDLSFAGRQGPDAFIHRHIAALTAGDVLALRRQADRWLLPWTLPVMSSDAWRGPLPRMEAFA